MKNSLKHQRNFQKIIKDDRLSPNRRMLAAMMLLYLEGKIPVEFLKATFGSDKKIKLTDDNDPPETNNDTVLEKETHSKLKDAFTAILNGEESKDEEISI